jgi:hypothetical protein
MQASIWRTAKNGTNQTTAFDRYRIGCCPVYRYSEECIGSVLYRLLTIDCVGRLSAAPPIAAAAEVRGDQLSAVLIVAKENCAVCDGAAFITAAASADTI